MLTGRVAEQLAKFWAVFYSRIVDPCYLPKPADVDDEQVKINFLRIVLGAAVVWRTGLVTIAAYYYYFSPHGFLACPPEFWLALLTLVLAACFTVGFLTPLATLGLILLVNHMDLTLSIATLGTNVLTCGLFFFLLANGGSRLSVDALSLKYQSLPLHFVTKACYGIVKFPSAEQLRVYLWLLFMSYAATSLGAVSNHVHDQAWLTGETMSILLSSSFLCSQWQICRALTAYLPWLISAVSAAVCVVQVAWQALMFPLVYTRWGAWFVGLYGAGFALGSLVLLQLSYLPWTEGVLWALVFCPARFITRIVGRADRGRDAGLWQPRWQVGAVTAVTLFTFVLFGATVAGQHYPSVKLLRKAAKHLTHKLYYLGLDAPDVFNRLDLCTGKYWYVMTRRAEDGRTVHVPVCAADGSREYYHWFDTICFRNFIFWKRLMGLYNGDPRELLERGQPCYQMIRAVANFDRRWNGLPADSEYLVTVYGSDDDTGKDPHILTTLTFGGSRRIGHSGRTVH